ncbi:hypothetical protein EGW08_005170 [Elysia chlorotica]|uniref:PHD-type domain-containing protein n=1 Tax=Elysia chlorotica TaxID=188477 RepID=A0A433TZS6_ELYCH|nr:hypothetical protein EGW08_005170 [Elysia chlorotica]
MNSTRSNSRSNSCEDPRSTLSPHPKALDPKKATGRGKQIPTTSSSSQKQKNDSKSRSSTPKSEPRAQDAKTNGADDSQDTPPEYCGTCANECRGDENSLQCELCDTWFHTTCEKIDDATYQILRRDADKPCALLHYYCSKSCNKAASKLLGGILKLETEVDQLKMKVGEVEEKITNIEDGEFTDKMIDAVKSITRDQNKENCRKEDNGTKGGQQKKWSSK